jgi:outer membrane protein OmpA-like peptidoglycan-associated protein
MRPVDLLLGAAVVAGGAICVRGLLAMRRLDRRQAADDDDEVTQQLRDHVEGSERRRVRQLLWLGALILVPSFLLLFVSFPAEYSCAPQAASSPPGVAKGAVPQPVPSVPGPAATPLLPIPTVPEPAATPLLVPFMVGSVVVIAIGAGLMLLGTHVGTRAVGGATIAAALLGNGYVIFRAKIDDLVKIDTLVKIDKPSINLPGEEPERQGQAQGQGKSQALQLAPERLGLLDGFAPGQAAIPEHARGRLDDICRRLRERGRERRGLVLVVGSTDRVRLAARARRQFESNVGLAQARAEQVREALVPCQEGDSNLVTLVAGPRHTPVPGTVDDLGGNPGDRSVAVYVVWNAPPR